MASDEIAVDVLGIQLQRVGSGNRMTFVEGEQALSAWMAQNAYVSWVVRDRPWDLEDDLIAALVLPLNLSLFFNLPRLMVTCFAPGMKVTLTPIGPAATAA